jgi:hypothetical protein
MTTSAIGDQRNTQDYAELLRRHREDEIGMGVGRIRYGTLPGPARASYA